MKRLASSAVTGVTMYVDNGIHAMGMVADANVADASCEYHVRGCMYPAAANYDPAAKLDFLRQVDADNDIKMCSITPFYKKNYLQTIRNPRSKPGL